MSATLFDLSGKACILTGASSGLGVQFARALDRAGAHVVLAARRVEAMNDLASEMQRAIVVPCDIAAESDVEALVRIAHEAFGRIFPAV